MNSLASLIRRNSFYFICFLLVLSIAIVLISSTDKINCFIMLNSLHTKWLDIIFICLTFLGNGLFSIITAAALLFIWKLRRLSLQIIITYLVSGIAAQLLKIFFIAPRPKEVIQGRFYNYFMEGITGSGWDSFPSGHTTSVFALATILALHAEKKWWGLFFLLIAILVGYSRIYLGQHFLQDVIAGSILGTAIGIIVYAFKIKRSSAVSHGEGSWSSEFAGN